jgi:DNA sulfur modification protein DndB
MKHRGENGSLPTVAPQLSLPVLRGIQAGRQYFVAMCPLSFIVKHLPFPPETLPPEKVIQRQINKSRIPKIADYLVKYFDDYILPPVIASIDGEVRFEALSEENENLQVGILHVPESADMIINDGQHRCAAIRHALDRRPELKMETLGVVFYIDRGVKRARQMFSDLNGHPIRTNRNITTTFDSRPYLSAVTKFTIDRCNILRDRVEMFASSCAVGSPRIFTISALDKAHGLLLKDLLTQEVQKDAEICSKFWSVLEGCLPKVAEMISGKVAAQDIKETYFYPYSIALQGLTASANQLIKERPKSWDKDLALVGGLDWRRSNSVWEGRAMNAGRLTTGGNHPILTRNLIKRELRLKLSEEEQRIEDAFAPQTKEPVARKRSA